MVLGMQLFHLNNYMNLSNDPPKNHFSKELDLKKYSNGMGAMGGMHGGMGGMSGGMRPGGMSGGMPGGGMSGGMRMPGGGMSGGMPGGMR